MVSHIRYVFKKAVNEAELIVLLPDKAPLIAKCSGGKDSLHCADFPVAMLAVSHCHQFLPNNSLLISNLLSNVYVQWPMSTNTIYLYFLCIIYLHLTRIKKDLPVDLIHDDDC